MTLRCFFFFLNGLPSFTWVVFQEIGRGSGPEGGRSYGHGLCWGAWGQSPSCPSCTGMVPSTGLLPPAALTPLL